MPDSSALTPQRAHALFDLLVHQKTYFADVVRFNRPDGIVGYGPPFDPATSTTAPSSAPVLQTLLSRFILPLPGVRAFTPTFWANVRKLLVECAGANLSDSYDHAGLGLRRTLAAGASALLEYPGRGVFGKIANREGKGEVKEYDLEDPEALKDAWEEFLAQAVHGDLVDRVFEKVAETDDLDQHGSLLRAAHEYILIHFASVLHYIYVESPDARYAQKLSSNLLKLIPWMMLRQSLRIGNAASMINAVVKLFLTKLSFTSFTNWVGLSNNPDDGMNLMQTIISTVMGWDVTEFEKKLKTIKESEDMPSEDYTAKLNEYVGFDYYVQESYRQKSQVEGKSIVTVIFEESSLEPLEGESHHVAVEYLGLRSKLRDREVLSKIICKSSPDILTQTIREGVAAYDPIFRAVHNAVDLSSTCLDLESFLRDFMKLFEAAPPSSNGTSTPTPKATQDTNLKKNDVGVEQFAAVLRKHQHSLHKFLHQMAKNGGSVTEDYRTYAKEAAAQLKSSRKEDTQPSAGDMTLDLEKLVAALPADKQKQVLEAVDMYAGYLMALTSVTEDRVRGVVQGNAPRAGPGVFLARWQNLLGATATTPTKPSGPVRYGSSRSVPEYDEKETEHDDDQWDKWPKAPDVKIVIDTLGKDFWKVLAEQGKEYWVAEEVQTDVD
ncbi:hypothetical protein BT63DRAFT_425892 [Microthyrium microscopicum]|uniref:PX domain-containing protein n=1 Tax=Microthyrium microscopicum TaxID=703497 RepID=A0A6A6U8K3_9PEZI|nr:hypothetical protein BT63DRAFT_425892 [Microthyrium microscopicum]